MVPAHQGHETSRILPLEPPSSMWDHGGMTTAEPGRGVLEANVPDPGTAIIWGAHDYPHWRVRWHHHPEVEFHLIRQGTGLMMVGDQLVPFHAGQVSMIGSELPHNWISDLAPGEVITRRDVYCLVRPGGLREMGADADFPEASAIRALLERAAHGIILSGSSARQARDLLEQMGGHSALHRLTDVFHLLALFADAPDDEWQTVVTPGFLPDRSPEAADRVNAALSYIASRQEAGALDVRMTEVADAVGMSPSAFSRFFHQATGITFSDMVTRLRISRACHLLTSTDWSVARIQAESGYDNASNFNRRFRAQTGTTPLAYRREHSLGGQASRTQPDHHHP